jgi:hypothetical protein
MVSGHRKAADKNRADEWEFRTRCENASVDMAYELDSLAALSQRASDRRQPNMAEWEAANIHILGVQPSEITGFRGDENLLSSAFASSLRKIGARIRTERSAAEPAIQNAEQSVGARLSGLEAKASQITAEYSGNVHPLETERFQTSQVSVP